ncbi:MAG TPA: rod shape-determining protein MreC [Caulobacteraceae bacterium]
MAYRDGPFENLKVPLTWAAALALVGAIVLGVVMLIGDRKASTEEGKYGAMRGRFDQVAAPVGGVFAAPVRWVGQAADWVDDYFFAVGENRRMKTELQELRAWRDQAIALKNVNARYEAMLGLRTEPAVRMVTGRSVSESRGPFKRARLIDVGAATGVRIGNPVINEHGLVGRVSGATGGVSRVLLLTDVASRIPILVDRTDARAIMRGDAGDNPRLEFMRGVDAVRPGDRILTSGDGGSLPRGLPVGVVARGVDGSWRVKLFSDRGAIDLVRVMLFQDFSQLANPDALIAPPLAGLANGAPPSPELAAQIRDAQARRDAAAAEQARQAQEQNAAAEAARRAAIQAPAAAQAPPAATPAPTTGAPTARPRPAAARPTPRPAPRRPAMNADGTPRRPVPYRAGGGGMP